MKFNGVIFDLNGTLLWDTALHNRAWDLFLERYRISLTDMEKNRIIHGKNNDLILKSLFGPDICDTEIESYVQKKEAIYRDLCIQSGISFAPGWVDFVRFLRSNKIRVAIATASGIENVDFYIHTMHLDRWVNEENIIFNDGKIKSKPDPEIFIKAMHKIGVDTNQVIIFEDSHAGIQAAENAGAGKIFIVNSTDSDYSLYTHDKITHFNQVPRSLFTNSY